MRSSLGARSAAFSLLALACTHCSDDAEQATSAEASSSGDPASSSSSPSSASATSTASTTTSGGGGDGGSSGEGGGGGSEVDPCSVEAMAEPATDVTYYVAIEEPGADDEACDGLAPTDEGDGHCPFRDLSSPAVASLLQNASSVRVELRAGTYVVSGWQGLPVVGVGGPDEPVVLSSYQGEEVVLDVASPDGATCTGKDAPDRPECVRQVVLVSGTHTVVQGLTIRNGLGYNLEVRGGADHVVRCNTLTETVEFPLRSDSLKLDGGATGVLVHDNLFTRWRSQAIDITQVYDVVVRNNEFTDPFDADAGATGTKLGSRGIVIRDNWVHDLGTDTSAKVFSLGGTGLDHDDDHAAYDVQVVGNRVEGAPGLLAQLVSCEGCTIADNRVSDIGAGILLSAAATGLPQCTAGAAGCGPSSGTVIAGNVLRDVDGGGDREQANVFVVVDEGEGDGLVGDRNVYCAPTADAARFIWSGDRLGFAEWVEASGTNRTSAATAASDPACDLDE